MTPSVPSLSGAFAKLQPLPEIAMRVMRVASNSEGSFGQLAELVRSDPALATEVLRLVNSAAVGLRARIQSVQHALTMLGLERVKSLALTVALRNFMAARLRVPVLRRCWRHSIACAVLAENIAAACRWNREVAYTAGLLHDIGRLGLLVVFPTEYAALLTEADAGPMDLRERERSLFGADHCEAGVILGEMYRFPEDLLQIVAHHHDPAPETFDTAASIRLACRMADMLGFAAAGAPPAVELDELKSAFPGCAWDALPDPPTLVRRIKLLDATL